MGDVRNQFDCRYFTFLVQLRPHLVILADTGSTRPAGKPQFRVTDNDPTALDPVQCSDNIEIVFGPNVNRTGSRFSGGDGTDFQKSIGGEAP